GDGASLRLAGIDGHDAAHYPLSLSARPGKCLQMRLEYRAGLFERGGVELMLARFVRLLEAAIGHPDQPVGRLDILAAAERHTLLHAWNDTVRPMPPPTFPQLFAAQVAATPDAVAVVADDQRLTYTQLDAQANQLAHHLRELGVGAETVVGLCVER